MTQPITQEAEMAKETKAMKLFALFKQRGRAGVTQLDAIREANYYRLPAFTHIMKRRGYTINSEWEKHKDGRHKRYWLEEASNDPEYRQRKSADTLDGGSANSKD